MPNVSLIDGHVDAQPKTNFENIKQMNIDELAEFIGSIYDYEYESPVYNKVEEGKHIYGTFIPNYDADKIKQWLESEVKKNESI